MPKISSSGGTAGRQGPPPKPTGKAGRPDAEDEDLELAADDFGYAEMEDLGDIEQLLPTVPSRRVAARRAIEAKLEELALRQALEDFPDYRILS